MKIRLAAFMAVAAAAFAVIPLAGTRPGLRFSHADDAKKDTPASSWPRRGTA